MIVSNQSTIEQSLGKVIHVQFTSEHVLVIAVQSHQGILLNTSHVSQGIVSLIALSNSIVLDRDHILIALLVEYQLLLAVISTGGKKDQSQSVSAKALVQSGIDISRLSSDDIVISSLLYHELNVRVLTVGSANAQSIALIADSIDTAHTVRLDEGTVSELGHRFRFCDELKCILLYHVRKLMFHDVHDIDTVDHDDV